MTEQDRIATQNESAPTPTVDETLAKKSKTPKKAIAVSTRKLTKKNSSLTDEQKRLARNAALREWRRAHADEQRAYYAAWHAKRRGQQPKKGQQQPDQEEQTSGERAATEILSTGTHKRAAPAMTKATSKKSKKGGKA